MNQSVKEYLQEIGRKGGQNQDRLARMSPAERTAFSRAAAKERWAREKRPAHTVIKEMLEQIEVTGFDQMLFLTGSRVHFVRSGSVEAGALLAQGGAAGFVGCYTSGATLHSVMDDLLAV